MILTPKVISQLKEVVKKNGAALEQAIRKQNIKHADADVLFTLVNRTIRAVVDSQGRFINFEFTGAPITFVDSKNNRHTYEITVSEDETYQVVDGILINTGGTASFGVTYRLEGSVNYTKLVAVLEDIGCTGIVVAPECATRATPDKHVSFYLGGIRYCVKASATNALEVYIDKVMGYNAGLSAVVANLMKTK